VWILWESILLKKINVTIMRNCKVQEKPGKFNNLTISPLMSCIYTELLVMPEIKRRIYMDEIFTEDFTS
jgi:hypothetical protein